jgi:hypothetical protein
MTNGTHVNIGGAKDAVTIGKNTMMTNNDNLVAPLMEGKRTANRGLERGGTTIGIHSERVIEVTAPQAATGVFENTAEVLLSITGVKSVEYIFFIEREGTIASGSYKNGAIASQQQAGHTGMIAFREGIMDKRLGGGIEAVKTAVSAHPQASLGVDQQTDNHIGTKRGGVGIIMEESLKGITVKTVQTIVSAYPNGALTILTQLRDETGRETVGLEELSALRISGNV